jgi:hypothetical protein
MEIALLINEYLKDKTALRDIENDSLNVVDNQIVSWNFTNIPIPSAEDLEALVPVVEAKISQDGINAEAMKYLADTDFYVVRLMDSGKPLPEGMSVLRQQARDKIVR